MTNDTQESNTRKKWNNLILHLHPKMVPEKALKFTLTFGLGGMAALLFVLLAITGILLRFVYVPTPEEAYNSILYLNNQILLGAFVRNIHYWSATLLVIVSFLHMLRVLFTGAYSGKRKSNWVIGVVLLLLVIVSNFSGYLLPWDQLAYWAITVSIHMLRYIPLAGNTMSDFVLQGGEVNENTLLFFYNMHTGILPLSIIILMSFHFWKIRKAGGIVIPKTDDNEVVKKVPVIPNLVSREFIAALFLIAFVLLLSVFFNAPLEDEANPLITPNPSKAPWYFMGFQELILHFHPVIAIAIIPPIFLILLFRLPNLKHIEPVQGVWFLSLKGKQLAIISSLSGLFLTLLFVFLNELLLRSLDIFKYGVISFSALLVFIVAGLFAIRKRYKANKAELAQTLLIFLFSSFLVLTLVGIYLRGEGMNLIFFN